MAKKTRRARQTSQLRNVQVPRAATRESVPAPAVAASTNVQSPPSSLRGATPAQAAVNFREEYHYVLSDLRRVAILALVMFAVLIGLAFALPALGL